LDDVSSNADKETCEFLNFGTIGRGENHNGEKMVALVPCVEAAFPLWWTSVCSPRSSTRVCIPSPSARYACAHVCTHTWSRYIHSWSHMYVCTTTVL